MVVIQKIRALNMIPTALHITDISNLSGIIAQKGIKCRNNASDFVDISDSGVQAIRSQKVVPQTNKGLHSYVPFYLSFKTPMVALRQNQNEQLVYIEVGLDIFTRLNGCFVTDGNATNGNTIFQPLNDVNAFKVLDLSVLYKVRYGADKEKARKKSAELLIPDFVPYNEFTALIFYSESGKKRGVEILANAGITPAIKVIPGYFFSQS